MRLRSLCTVGTIALASVVFSAPSATADVGFRVVGTLDRFDREALDTFPALFRGSPFESRMLNGTLLPVPQAGRLWQVYRATASGTSGVLVRDDRTLKVIGSFPLDTLLRRATFSIGYGAEWLHAGDGGRRVFLVDRNNRLLEVDTATFAVRDLGMLSFVEPATGREPLAVGGLTWDATSERLLVLFGGPPSTTVANRVTALQQFDPDTGTRVNRVVRSCTGPLPVTDFTGDTLATAPMALTDAVYVPCQQDTFAPGFGLLSTSIVVRLPRASLGDADGEEASVVVGGPMDSALSDPAGGRITVLDWEGRFGVVDVRTMTVVGSFHASPGGSGRVGPGIDPATGRVFFQSDLGLGRIDARATPPTFAVDPSFAAEGQEGIVTVGHRIFVLTGHAHEKALRYTIHQVVP